MVSNEMKPIQFGGWQIGAGTTSSGAMELPPGRVDQPPPVIYNINREAPEKLMSQHQSYSDWGQPMGWKATGPCPICAGNHSAEDHQATKFTNQVMGLEATNPDPVVTEPKSEPSTFGIDWSRILFGSPVKDPRFTPAGEQWGPNHPLWPGGA